MFYLILNSFIVFISFISFFFDFFFVYGWKIAMNFTFFDSDRHDAELYSVSSWVNWPYSTQIEWALLYVCVCVCLSMFLHYWENFLKSIIWIENFKVVLTEKQTVYLKKYWRNIKELNASIERILWESIYFVNCIEIRGEFLLTFTKSEDFDRKLHVLKSSLR